MSDKGGGLVTGKHFGRVIKGSLSILAQEHNSRQFSLPAAYWNLRQLLLSTHTQVTRGGRIHTIFQR